MNNSSQQITAIREENKQHHLCVMFVTVDWLQEISSTLGCPEDTAGLINCLKNQKTVDEIVGAHKKYYVSCGFYHEILKYNMSKYLTLSRKMSYNFFIYKLQTISFTLHSIQKVNIKGHCPARRDQRVGVPADCWNCGKWGLMEYKWRGFSLVGLLGSSCRYKRFFYPAFAALVSPVQNIFLLTAHFSTIASPLPRNLGRQSCRVACLLICVSGRTKSKIHRVRDQYLCLTSSTHPLKSSCTLHLRAWHYNRKLKEFELSSYSFVMSARVFNTDLLGQLAERADGRLGFGGSAPCAQTHGREKFITKERPIIV